MLDLIQWITTNGVDMAEQTRINKRESIVVALAPPKRTQLGQIAKALHKPMTELIRAEVDKIIKRYKHLTSEEIR